jgi:hypothetical protein
MLARSGPMDESTGFVEAFALAGQDRGELLSMG